MHTCPENFFLLIYFTGHIHIFSTYILLFLKCTLSTNYQLQYIVTCFIHLCNYLCIRRFRSVPKIKQTNRNMSGTNTSSSQPPNSITIPHSSLSSSTTPTDMDVNNQVFMNRCIQAGQGGLHVLNNPQTILWWEEWAHLGNSEATSISSSSSTPPQLVINTSNNAESLTVSNSHKRTRETVTNAPPLLTSPTPISIASTAATQEQENQSPKSPNFFLIHH